MTTNSHCPDTLTECASQLAWLTQADGMRQFFDDDGEYDSTTIFNLFSLCEEVGNRIEKGRYSAAEELIRDHYRHEVNRELNPISTCYCEKEDITFIMKKHFALDGTLETQECIGWYHGEPNPKCTRENANNGMKANYLI